LKTLGKRVHEEQGQMLIMGVLAMTLVLLIGVLVVDFGLWFSGRASVVNAADQAAMSASLNLPKDGAGATATALQYVQANDPEITPTVTFRCIVGDRNHDGLPDSVDITVNCPQLAATPGVFTCYSTSWLCYANCGPPSGANVQCNTIVVQGSKNVPFGFGPAFGIAGAQAAGFTSAACTGACGVAPPLPLDVVIIIDRTGSMQPSDLANAKAGAKSVLTIFDPAVQHVALGTLPPSPIGDDCHSVNSNSAPGNWVLTSLTPSNYRNADGSLNNSSKIVTDINCLQTAQFPGNQTDLGDALKAAADYLQANGRPGVKKGIILLTDGAANVPAGDTGYLNCTTQLAVPGSPANGHGNGYETNPLGACAQGGQATDSNSGTVANANPTCTESGHDRHDFWGFGASVPAPYTSVTGVEVQVRASATSGASIRTLCAQLSWDGGLSWGTAAPLVNPLPINLTTSLATYDFNPGSTNWGHVFVPSEVPNIRVRITDLSSNTTTTFSLASVQLRVYYSKDGGPCDYAATQSAAARAAGIEIFTIGYGVGQLDRFCTSVGQGGVEGIASPYQGERTTQLLAYMAMGDIRYDDGGKGFGSLNGGCTNATDIAGENADGDNFLCEAKGKDLTAVFTAAAEALASGSRLVKIPF
jgi:hypothetical protein